MPPRTTPEAVTTALTDVAFPAEKDALVSGAEQNNADPETVRAIRGVPPVRYGSVSDVVAAVQLVDEGPAGGPVNPIADELGTNRKQ